MEKWLERIEKKVDSIDGKIDTLNVATAEQAIHISRNTADLEHHIRRTEQNEEMILALKEEQAKGRAYLKAFHITLGVIATVVGIVVAINKI